MSFSMGLFVKYRLLTMTAVFRIFPNFNAHNKAFTICNKREDNYKFSTKPQYPPQRL